MLHRVRGVSVLWLLACYTIFISALFLQYIIHNFTEPFMTFLFRIELTRTPFGRLNMTALQVPPSPLFRTATPSRSKQPCTAAGCRLHALE